MNKVIQLGRLTDSPKIYQGKEGKEMVTFSIANDEFFGKDKITHFHSCVCFIDHTAKFMQKHCEKGDEVLIEGRLTYEKYEGKTYAKIKCQSVNLTKKCKSGQAEINDLKSDSSGDLPLLTN